MRLSWTAGALIFTLASYGSRSPPPKKNLCSVRAWEKESLSLCVFLWIHPCVRWLVCSSVCVPAGHGDKWDISFYSFVAWGFSRSACWAEDSFWSRVKTRARNTSSRYYGRSSSSRSESNFSCAFSKRQILILKNTLAIQLAKTNVANAS